MTKTQLTAPARLPTASAPEAAEGRSLPRRLKALLSGRRPGVGLERAAWVVGPVALMLLTALPLSAAQLSLATSAVVYAIIATGLGMIYGQLGLLSMSHAALWGVGSYSAFVAAYHWHWSFWAALPFAVLVAVTIGAATATPAFRLRGHHFLIFTFLVTALAASVEARWKSLTGGLDGLLVARPPDSILGVSFGSLLNFYYLSTAALILVLILYQLVQSSRLGRMFQAVRESPRLAASLGIDPTRHILVGFALSGVFAGIGGTLFAYQVKQIEPTFFGLNAVVLLPLIVILGGPRLVWGPTVGAFLVVFLPDVLRLSPLEAQALNGVLLCLIILLLPRGVLGSLGETGRRRLQRPTAQRPT